MSNKSLSPQPSQPVTLHTAGSGTPAYVPAPGSQGAPDEVDLRAVWGTLRRNWLVILGCFIAAVALGWVHTARIAPTYQAEATLRIDAEGETPGLDLLNTLGGNGESKIETEMEVLRSRTLAREVVEALGLRVRLAEPARLSRSRFVSSVRIADPELSGSYVFTRTGAGGFDVVDGKSKERVGSVAPGGVLRLPGATIGIPMDAGAHERFTLVVDDAQQATIGLLGGLGVSRPNPDAVIVAVRYRGTDPELVRDIPNALVNTFVERRLQIKKAGATSTIAFLRSQLDTITAQLRRSEDSLRAFRESEQVVSLQAEGQAQVHNLAELQAQRNQIESERTALGRLVEQVGGEPAASGQPSPYRRLLAYPTLLRNASATELLSSLTRLDNERSQLLQRRTVQDPDVLMLSRMIADVEAQVRGVVLTYLAGLQEQVRALDATMASSGKRLEAIPAREVRFARLQRNTQVLSDIQTMLQTKLKESEITQAVEDPSVRAVDMAYRPEWPVAPRKSLNLMVAGMLGLMLGVVVAFGREWMDTAVHSKEDVQAATGVAVLGLIPHIRDAALPKYRLRRRKDSRSVELAAAARPLSLVAGRDPRSMIAEAYRTLRTNLTFARSERTPKIIVFTSPSPGDGKTTSVANLAATLAQQGLRVLVMDADLRRGFLHRVFEADRGPGLSDVLIGRVDVAEAIQEVTLETGARLSIVATGTLPPNPAELLASERLRQMLDRLDPLYEIILIDSPPVNLFTDAALIGTQADGVLLVARAGKSQKSDLQFGMDQLRNVRVTVLGAILNDFDIKRDVRYDGAYYYSPRYSYSTSEAS